MRILISLIVIITIQACTDVAKTTQNPVISDIRISVDINTAKLSWSTNENTNGKVEYGIDDSYGMEISSEINLTTQHQVSIAGLQPNLQYFYRIIVEDSDKNEVKSAGQTFTTAGVPLNNNYPRFVLPGNHSVNAGELLEIVLDGNDPDPQDLQFSVSNPPLGSTFNTSTFSWTPSNAQVGVHNIEFTITDGMFIVPEASTITVHDPLVNAPGEPIDLLSTISDETKVSLAWTAATDLGGTTVGIREYKLYRDGVFLQTLGNVVSYDDTTIVKNMTYKYEITAVDYDDNESGRSNAIFVSTYDANLVSYWPFQPRQGTQVFNVIRNHWGEGKVGTLVYDVSNSIPWTTGYRDSAIQFPGLISPNQPVYVDLNTMEIPPKATLDQMTIAAWIYIDEITRDARIISKADGTTEASHYWMLSTHQPEGSTELHLRFRLKTNGTTSTLFGGNLPLTTWTHVAASYDGANMAIYINGASINSLAKTGIVDQGISVPVRIGINPDGSRPFKGRIDEMRVYNRALTPNELGDLISVGP